MITSVSRRKAIGLAAIAAALVLNGCASSNHSTGSPMMGGTGYHYSGLTCPAPKALPGTVVNVTLADMGMTQMMSGTAPLGSHMMLRATPATAAAGQISIVASNMGWRTHELVILPLTAGVSAGHRVPGSDGKVDETGSLGEASASCAAGTGDGVTAGSVGWMTVTLAPGHYELLCNLANHYADGMWQELIIT
ncbi:MAG: hypothetical protein M3Y89_15855 [Actinomycetota bacterium]|nr:hypothetical protein [Actinomycetota bacterium]